MPRKVAQKLMGVASLPLVTELGYLKGAISSRIIPTKHFTIAEFGCGTAEFLIAYAVRYPERYCIGIDIQGERIYDAARNAEKFGLVNIGFYRADLRQLDLFCDTDVFNEIWITFPDPHVKRRRAPLRLVHHDFLSLYARILKPNGKLHIKTDDKGTADFAIRELSGSSFTIKTHESNLPQNTDHPKYLQTKYEKKFRLAKKQIHYIEAIHK